LLDDSAAEVGLPTVFVWEGVVELECELRRYFLLLFGRRQCGFEKLLDFIGLL
jgi:hypothetical protein